MTGVHNHGEQAHNTWLDMFSWHIADSPATPEINGGAAPRETPDTRAPTGTPALSITTASGFTQRPREAFPTAFDLIKFPLKNHTPHWFGNFILFIANFWERKKQGSGFSFKLWWDFWSVAGPHLSCSWGHLGGPPPTFCETLIPQVPPQLSINSLIAPGKSNK